jgi:hypothetical protein
LKFYLLGGCWRLKAAKLRRRGEYSRAIAMLGGPCCIIEIIRKFPSLEDIPRRIEFYKTFSRELTAPKKKQ